MKCLTVVEAQVLAHGCQLARIELVETHQPIRLVQAVLADQRWRPHRQARIGVRDRAERRVIYAPQLVRAVRRARSTEDLAIAGRRRAHDDLRALTGRRKRVRPTPEHAAILGEACAARPSVFFRLQDLLRDRVHRAIDVRARFFRREPRQIGRVTSSRLALKRSA